MPNTLQETYGNIDIYAFDQLLKGRYDDCKKVLDAGCGGGRNLYYFLRNGFEVFGIDPNPQAIAEVKALSARLAPNNQQKNFTVSTIEEMPLDGPSFDLVICNTVLHFARDEAHFDGMLHSLFRVLKPGGFFLCPAGIKHRHRNVGKAIR